MSSSRRVPAWVLRAVSTVALVLVAASGLPAVPAAAQDADPWIYRPPVAAPVTDPFRPPPQPWLSGNRGLEYATVAGTPVRAIAPGRVTFAGPVAGALYVTVRHPDGLRSSYSYLAAVRVAEGQRVTGGEAVGVAGSRLHLGVRRPDDTYLDPASLWGRRVTGGVVHLVPLDGGPEPPSPAGARDPARAPVAAWARVGRRVASILGANLPIATLLRRPATRWAETKRPPGSTHGRRRGSAAPTPRIRASLNRG